MSTEELIKNMMYLINKYIPERTELVEVIKNDSDSTKYILAEISRHKKQEYDIDDAELIKDIAFYYL